MSLYSIENEAFKSLVKYGGIVLGKMLAMSVLTIRKRVANKVFVTPEDVKAFTNTPEEAKRAFVRNDDIERVRSAHLNDIENIVPFTLIALLYIGTNPDPNTAALLFKVFAGCRITHTLVYLGKVPQPARFLFFTGGFVPTIYMLYQTLRAVW